MESCKFCKLDIEKKVLLENDLCLYIEHPSPVLVGSGMILTKVHRETVFDMTEAEITSAFRLLKEVKSYIDDRFMPDGYNVGWNCMEVGGQTVAHVHLHVIPRFKDEPMAGKGIRHHLKQEENRRNSIS
jgi:diadenosine tetraphosphate (Ap4A) HIT family hydrolase